MTRCPRKGRRSVGAVRKTRAAPTASAAGAKVTPPTQVELSKPAAATSARTTAEKMLGRCASRLIRKIAATAQDADITCCGTQAAWNSQPAKPVPGSRTDSNFSAPHGSDSNGRSDPATANGTIQSAADRRALNHTANPIIMASEEKAVNQVI